MSEPYPTPPVNTFVVRFWREWSAAGPRWRGRIEHVQTRQSANFTGVDAMLDFVRRFGVLADEEPRSAKKDDGQRPGPAARE